MKRAEREQVKDMKQTEAERELDSQEAEKLAQTISGLEIPPSTENLAEKMEAARKRVEAYKRGD